MTPEEFKALPTQTADEYRTKIENNQPVVPTVPTTPVAPTPAPVSQTGVSPIVKQPGQVGSITATGEDETAPGVTPTFDSSGKRIIGGPTETLKPLVDPLKKAQMDYNQPTPQVDTTTTKVDTTPTGTITKVEKPKETINYDTIQGREKEALDSLLEGQKNAPQLFKDEATFRAAYGYDTALPDKKKALDNFFQSTQVKDADGIYNTLRAGGQIYNPVIKQSPEYKKAEARLNNVQKYSAYNENELAKSMVNGDVLPGTTLYNDLIKDPNVKIKIDKANAINKLNGETTNIDSKNTKIVDSEIKDTNKIINDPTINSYLTDGNISKEEFSQMTNTPEYIDASKKVTEQFEKYQTAKKSYDDLKRTYDGIRKNTIKELEGTGANKIALEVLIAQRQNDMVDSLNLAGDDLNREYGAYTEYRTLAKEAKTDAIDLFKTNLGLYQDDKSFARQKELAEYQADLALATNQKEFEQKLDQQLQLANDPIVGVDNILETYSKLGITPERSRVEIINDIQNQVKEGKPLGDALSELNAKFQGKDEYKAIQTAKQQEATGNALDLEYKREQLNQLRKKATEQGYEEVATGVYRNKETNQLVSEEQLQNMVSGGTGLGDIRYMANQFPNQAWAKNNNPAGITWNANFDNPKPGTTAQRLIDAGIQFSKGTARPAKEGGNYVTFNTIEDGLAAQRIMMTQTYGNSTVGQMLAKWVGTKEGPNYAKQVAGNAGIDVNSKVSDLSDEQVSQLQMAKIQKESPGLAKLLKQSQTTTGPKEYTTTQKNIMYGMDAKALSSQELKTLKQNGLSADDIYNYKASLKADKWSAGLDDTEYKRVNSIIDDLSTNQVTKTFQKAQEAYDAANTFAKGNTATDNQALIYAFAKAMDPDSVVREGEYATVQKYSQVWGDKLGTNINRVLNGQEFISQQAKDNLVKTIKSKYETSKNSYNNLRNTKIKMINDVAGKDIGEKALVSEINPMLGNTTSTTQNGVIKPKTDPLGLFN